jgi:hypothetical protein
MHVHSKNVFQILMIVKRNSGILFRKFLASWENPCPVALRGSSIPHSFLFFKSTPLKHACFGIDASSFTRYSGSADDGKQPVTCLKKKQTLVRYKDLFFNP